MEKHYDDLLLELECPICTLYMTPPIRQCATGHSFCNTCQNKLPVCPLCQEKFTDTKNLTLESLARKMHYPCPNNKFGCMARLMLDERAVHEKLCTFKSYSCAYSKCKWTGKYQDLLNHWNEKKLSSRPYRNVNVCHMKLQKPEVYYVNLIQAYDALFWYKFRCTGGKLTWTIQFIGPTENANDYYFEIELFKPGQTIRRMLLSEYCQPVDIPHELIFKAGCSVMTTLEAVKPYFGDDELLIYYMRVKECKSNCEGGAKQQAARGKSLSRESSCSRESLSYLGEVMKESQNHQHKFNKFRGAPAKRAPNKKAPNKEPEK